MDHGIKFIDLVIHQFFRGLVRFNVKVFYPISDHLRILLSQGKVIVNEQ